MADLLNADLTDEDIATGTGLFDTLMRSMSLRLQEELENGRIQSSDYAKIYLGAMESALSQSIAYLIQKQTVNEQASLITAQTASEVLQASLITAQTNKVNSEKTLTDQQYAIAVIAAANATKEGLQLTAQTALVDAEKFKLVNSDTALITAQTSKLGKDEDKLTADIALVNQQKANVLAAVTNIPKAGEKIDAEVAVLSQKGYTEQAQTKDTVGPAGSTYTVGGLVKKQKDLYNAQGVGFTRDAEQKAAKIVVDAWSVRASVDPDTMTEPAGISDTDITAIMAQVKTGINV